MHLARLHQKHSSLAAAAASSMTESTQTAADAASVSASAASSTSARPNNAPMTGDNSASCLMWFSLTLRSASLLSLFALIIFVSSK